MNKKSFYGRKNTDPQLLYFKYQKKNKNLTHSNKFSTSYIVGRIWNYFKVVKYRIIFCIFLSIVSALAQTVALYFISYIYDKYLMNTGTAWSDPHVFSAFIVCCISALILYVANNITWFAIEIIMMRASEWHVCYRMRKDLFEKLQHLPVKFFDTTPSGELITRTSNDIDNISWGLSQYLIQDVYWFFVIICVAILMFMINWALALITILIYPVMIFTTSRVTAFIRPYYGRQQREVGHLNSFVEERISGVKIISLYEQEKLNAIEFAKINNKLTDNSIIANAFSNILNPLNQFFNNLAFVILTALGISLAAIGAIHTDWGVFHYENISALLVIFTIFTRNLTNPFNQIVLSLGSLILAEVSAQRVFSILDQPEEKDLPNAWKPKSIKGVVEAKHMYFGYDSSKMILKDINFKATPNKVTALVGPTGAGKTTIVSLITKFYDINQGNLLIDGHRIQDIDRNALRKHVTIVLQDTFLFSKTIRENIRYGRLDATDEEVEQAAIAAHADPFIRSLPHQYDTILNDNGSNLSQGQRQLLAIARAFLADSKIVILDEASSSIDTKTELDVQNALKKLMHNRTTFMIAHRLSTIRDADNILVLKDGEIVEHGKHNELIAKKGFYASLYNSQFEKGEEI